MGDSLIVCQKTTPGASLEAATDAPRQARWRLPLTVGDLIWGVRTLGFAQPTKAQ